MPTTPKRKSISKCMGEHRFQAGDFISLRTAGLSGFFRIVQTDRVLALAYLFPIDFTHNVKPEDGTAKKRLSLSAKSPRQCDLDWLLGLSEQECCKTQLTLPSWVDRPLESLAATANKTYQEIKNRTEQLADPENLRRLLAARSYSSELAKLGQQFSVHRTTIARDLARYFICDCDVHKASMFAALALRPSNPLGRKVGRKLGRKNKLLTTGHLPSAEGVNVNEEVKLRVEVYLTSLSERAKLTKAAMYRGWKDNFASVPAGSLADGTIVWKTAPELNITNGQFNYWLNKLETVRAQTEAKVGRKSFTKDLRVLIGTARDQIEYPGQCYVIDSTVADVYLVCVVDRRLLIGRPTIYVVIDAFSSLIVAIQIGLENPCLDQAQKALYRAISAKDVLFERLGLSKELLSALPQGCKPTTIFADRGELLSDGSRKMSARARIALSLAAPYRADWKSLVERYFGIQNEQVLHWIPGGVRERMRERGNRDVRLDATLTINGLYRLLFALAAEWNLTKDMSKHVSTAMLRKEVPANPLGFWRYGLDELHASPRYPTREEAMRWMLSPVQAKVGRTGIKVLEGLRFTAPWMSEDDAYFDQIQDGKGLLYLDPDQPLEALFHLKASDELRPVQLVDTRHYSESDISLEDIRMTEDYIHLCQDEAKLAQDPTVATLRRMRSEEVGKESKLTADAKKLDSRPKSERVSNIKQNRRDAIARGDQNEPAQAEIPATQGRTPTEAATRAAREPIEDDAWTRAMNLALGPEKQ